MESDGYLFSKDHIWVKTDGNDVLLGLSAYAVERLKAVMFINLPELGGGLEAGEKFGDVESIKTVSDLISPVTGKVLAVNDEAVDDPEMLAEAPYECWLVRVGDATLAQGLMDRAAYESGKDRA